MSSLASAAGRRPSGADRLRARALRPLLAAAAHVRGWPLRVRLVVAAVLVVAGLCAVIGTLVAVSLHGYLYSELQDKLDAAVRFHGPGDGFPGGSDAADRAAQNLQFLNPPGLPSHTVGAYIDPQGVLGSAGYHVPTASGPPATQYLTGDQRAVLQGALAPGYHQVTLPGLGRYLVEVQPGQPHTGGSSSILVGMPLDEVDGTVTQLVETTVVVSAAGLLAGALLFGWITRLALRPLDRVAATAAQVSRLPLHRGEVVELDRVPERDTDPRTEAGRVGAALNRLLDHVAEALAARHASETRVRRFVADASHELRTPLASIRGYAELTRRGREDVPPDTAYALRRVESEADRMTAMVEDLLLLARLDAGRPLERAEVDLAPLVVDVVRDAHAAGPDHRWSVDLPAEGEPMPVVTGDQHRLQQVLVNLLGNARNHTPPGTRVTAGARVAADGWCELRVVDDGPGIPAALQPRVFERFARGDASRSRAAGSTGLGLAIVSAVVASHRGAVTVASVPGRTEFLVRLPPAARPSGTTASG